MPWAVLSTEGIDPAAAAQTSVTVTSILPRVAFE